MKLLMGGIFLCCLAESFSSPYAPPKSAIPIFFIPEGTPRNPTNAELKSYWTFSDAHMFDLNCDKGKIVYAIEAQRNCRSYLKCESGNLPARIRCPYRQVFSKDTLNCEDDGLCAGMTLEEREELNKRYILEKNPQQEFPNDIPASQNKSPEEMVINDLEHFLKSLLCLLDIKNDYRNCPNTLEVLDSFKNIVGLLKLFLPKLNTLSAVYRSLEI